MSTQRAVCRLNEAKRGRIVHKIDNNSKKNEKVKEQMADSEAKLGQTKPIDAVERNFSRLYRK